MLDSSIARIFELVDNDDVVLDVGGWIKPFTRADYVIDLLPYTTRGDLGAIGTGPERFDESRWIQRDICDREPFPFADDQFDFAICSHTLEDVRDPIWVCAEISRVARAGYVEVPSRAEEQSYGFDGRFTGWGHHRWLVDVADGGLEFTMKSERVELPAHHFPSWFWSRLSPADRVEALFWEEALDAREQIFVDAVELDAYLAAIKPRWQHLLVDPPRPSVRAFFRSRIDRLR